MRNEVIELIKKTYEKDSRGVKRETESTREVFCSVKSATSSEWMNGGRMGLNPAYTFTISLMDYDHEESCIFRGVKYVIYRTYERENSIELHVQKEKGA